MFYCTCAKSCANISRVETRAKHVAHVLTHNFAPPVRALKQSRKLTDIAN